MYLSKWKEHFLAYVLLQLTADLVICWNESLTKKKKCFFALVVLSLCGVSFQPIYLPKKKSLIVVSLSREYYVVNYIWIMFIVMPVFIIWWMLSDTVSFKIEITGSQDPGCHYLVKYCDSDPDPSQDRFFLCKIGIIVSDQD